MLISDKASGAISRKAFRLICEPSLQVVANSISGLTVIQCGRSHRVVGLFITH